MNRILLCTDLDRTLIPNDVMPESSAARPLFRRLCALDSVTLAYVSGRDRGLIEQAMDEFDLPVPDVAISDVGATIHRICDGQWCYDQAWEDEIAPDWNGLTASELHEQLAAFNGLTLQETAKQGRYKLSYYTAENWPDSGQDGMIRDHLSACGIRCNLIWSLDHLSGKGLLDILPQSANKLHAIRFIAGELGFNREAILFAGDSGNDREVLHSDIPSVLVANASAEVRAQAMQAGQSLIIARGTYLGMNGHYAAGILEGLAHYHPAYAAWLEEQS